LIEITELDRGFARNLAPALADDARERHQIEREVLVANVGFELANSVAADESAGRERDRIRIQRVPELHRESS